MTDGTQWDDISVWYPDGEFWYIETKSDGVTRVVTMDYLRTIFDEDRLVRMQNGFDKYYSIFRKE